MRFRRLLQFRLLSLIACLTVAAVGMAIWKVRVEPYWRQAKAIESLSPYITETQVRPVSSFVLRALLPEEQHVEITSITLTSKRGGDTEIKLTSEQWEQLTQLRFVERLYLPRTNFRDAQCQILPKLPHLRRLALWQTRITDDGLSSIGKCTGLEALDIHGTYVTDLGLSSLSGLEQLSLLKLGRGIEGPGLRHVAPLKSLKILDLSHAALLPGSVELLAGAQLRSLQLPRMIDSAMIPALASMPHLEELNQAIINATDEDTEYLPRCKRLKRLDLRGPELTDRAAKCVAQMRNLEFLCLDANRCTQESLEMLWGLPKLRYMVVVGFDIAYTNRLT